MSMSEIVDRARECIAVVLFVAIVAMSVAIAAALMTSKAQARSPITCIENTGCSDLVPSQRYHRHAKHRNVDANGNSLSLAGIVEPLKAKALEIKRACGSRIVSAYRRGARIPTGRLSNHARHRAVDLRGNPRCIYAHLKGWPGGYSIDYARAPGGPHVHISYNRNMEWGARFRHHRIRHARNWR